MASPARWRASRAARVNLHGIGGSFGYSCRRPNPGVDRGPAILGLADVLAGRSGRELEPGDFEQPVHGSRGGDDAECRGSTALFSEEDGEPGAVDEPTWERSSRTGSGRPASCRLRSPAELMSISPRIDTTPCASGGQHSCSGFDMAITFERGVAKVWSHTGGTEEPGRTDQPTPAMTNCAFVLTRTGERLRSGSTESPPESRARLVGVAV